MNWLQRLNPMAVRGAATGGLLFLVLFNAVNFGAQIEWIANGSAWWAVAAVLAWALLLFFRQSRHRLVGASEPIRRFRLVAEGLALAWFTLSLLNLVPTNIWHQAYLLSLDHLRIQPTVVQVGGEAGDGKAAEEAIARWGTLFSWLLAVVALVIAFVTSWVFSLSREIRVQLDAASNMLDLDRRTQRARLDLLLVAATADLLVVRERFDPNQQANERVACTRLMAIMRLVSRTQAPVPDWNQLHELLNKQVAALIAWQEMKVGIHTDFCEVAHDTVTPCLLAQYEMLMVMPSAQHEAAQLVIEDVAAAARWCRTM